MRKILLVFALLSAVGFSVANATTVYYQPTPYPLLKMDGSTMSQKLEIVHVWDGWFNNNYEAIKSIQRDDKLQIGGWGDYYASTVRFDLTGLPNYSTSTILYLWALPSGSPNPSQVSIFPITSNWDVVPSQTYPVIGWNNLPQTTSGYYWPISTVVNGWRSYTITNWYNEWKQGKLPDKGLLFWPYNNDGRTRRFDKFSSSRAVAGTDARYFSTRPLIAFTFVPTLELKMPLPGNYRWLVTTEIGGYDCNAELPQHWPDTAHQGSNYYSIDFSYNNMNNIIGATPYGLYNTPILAAKGGVIQSAAVDHPYNGNYVVINHNNDKESNTGFSTRYLHLRSAPARKNGVLLKKGDIVAQGDQIGIMGNTPTSAGYGIHLHFGVRYNDDGKSSISQLSTVVMEGKLLKSYQTESSVNASGIPGDWNRYYSSTLAPTGK